MVLEAIASSYKIEGGESLERDFTPLGERGGGKGGSKRKMLSLDGPPEIICSLGMKKI